jgi:ketosteroid isomerase-like protein
MDIELFIADWLAAANAYDRHEFAAKWQENAVLKDTSIGEIFTGHTGIRSYFEDYFIGYKTQTKLLKLIVVSDKQAHVEVAFTGDFPGKKIKGTFDLTFSDGLISAAQADLL